MLFKSTVAVVAGCAATVSAQVSAIPACADQCIISAVQSAGCGLSDYYCQCTTGKAKITAQATSCLLKSSCTTGQITNITVAIANICSAAVAAGPTTSSSNSTTSNSTSSSSSGSSSSGSTSSSASSSSPATQSNAATRILSTGSALAGLSLIAMFAL